MITITLHQFMYLLIATGVSVGIMVGSWWARASRDDSLHQIASAQLAAMQASHRIHDAALRTDIEMQQVIIDTKTSDDGKLA